MRRIWTVLSKQKEEEEEEEDVGPGQVLVCIAGRTSSRTDAADPATPTRGGADPATARIQVDAKGKLPRTPRSMHCTICDVP